jgi:hypothetical protein
LVAAHHASVLLLHCSSGQGQAAAGMGRWYAQLGWQGWAAGAMLHGTRMQVLAPSALSMVIPACDSAHPGDAIGGANLHLVGSGGPWEEVASKQANCLVVRG